MDHYIGKLLDNRYEILEVVGTGGMARVYKARDHRLNRLVAIKILREDLAQDAEFRRRFHDESQAVAMLSHPNIVAIYDVSRSSELEYIVMELIDGITLKQYMHRKGAPLNWREALHFIIQITKALGHAHSRGIIHRDIKPHNVMVLRDGSVKVADFGIARVSSGGHSTLTQEALGSVHYISPEQARGSHIDARSDLYSAGVVLYEMITGRLPFEGDNPVSVAIQHINAIPLSPRELDPSIPEALEAITMKAMAPDPDDRYLSADEMLTDLEEFRKNPDINFDYHTPAFDPEEELDEDRTQIRPVPPSQDRERRERRERREDHRDSRRPARDRRSGRYDDEDDDRRGGFPWAAVIAVLAVLAFLVVAVYVLFQTVLSGFAPPESFPVPDLTGKIYEEIVDDTELLGRFTVKLGETVADDAPVGTILRQDPAEKSQVTAAVTEITVTVSGGLELTPVPDVKGMEYRQAFLDLNSAGLKYTYTMENHAEVPADHVISTNPLAGTPVAPGSEVTMVISLGPEVKPVTLPSFLDQPLEKAKTDIEMMKLVLGETALEYSDTVPEGVVLRQYPDAATEVPEGTTVNLWVSQGPDPAATKPQEPDNPPPVPSSQVTKYIDIPLPASETQVELMVMMNGDVVWKKTYDPTMDISASVPVSAPSGTGKTITWYFNGNMGGSLEIVFLPDE